MTGRGRLWILALSLLALLAMILVATGLRQMEFSPGYDLPVRQTETPPGAPDSSPDNNVLDDLYLVLFFIAIPFVPLALLYLILSSEGRRRLWRSLALFLWLMLVFVFLRTEPALLQPAGEALPPQVTPGPSGTTLAGSAPSPPAWMVWGASIVLALLVAAALVGAAWFVWHRAQPAPRTRLDQVAQEAQRALVALKAGADLKDTVRRCYFEMARVLREERDLRRDSAMTPREFENYLADAGLPREPVQELTRLFESVRYGDKMPAGYEEQQAIACLTAIVNACQAGA